MIPRPNNRVVQSGDTATRKPARVVGAKGQTASVQAHRAMATVRDILGRDPKQSLKPKVQGPTSGDIGHGTLDIGHNS